MTIRVSLIPWAGREVASSRIRVFALEKALNAMPGVEAGIWLTQADVAVAQKLSDPRDMDAVGKAEFGLRVYDFDDPMSMDVMKLAHEVCDAFTTDTDGHRQWYLDRGFTKPCLVVPDCVDYVEAPLAPVEASGSAVWFGNKENEVAVHEMATDLMDAGVRVGFISNQHGGYDPRLQLVRWGRLTLVEDLRSFGTCLLSHSGLPPGKSNNKMTAAISLGLPCIAEAGCCYEDLLVELGIAELLVYGDWTAVDAFRYAEDPGFREHEFPYVQQAVWDVYSPAAVAKTWLDAVCEVKI